MSDVNAPPRLLLEPIVRAALAEDLGRAGDITSAAVIPPDAETAMVFRAREAGVLAGLAVAGLAFELMDPALSLAPACRDGDRLQPGTEIARIEGPARALLSAERVALNFLGHLSGIATATAAIAEAISHTRARIVCTRKTTPGLRLVEKYAVRCGGGVNHRFGLDDAILIKDNHIAVAGSVSEALNRAKGAVGHMVRIEIEVDTLAQLDEALAAGADAVLLDNMDPDTLRQAVARARGKAVTEASGRITVESARAIAEAGVDYLSSGALTHSVKTLDIGLDAAR